RGGMAHVRRARRGPTASRGQTARRSQSYRRCARNPAKIGRVRRYRDRHAANSYAAGLCEVGNHALGQSRRARRPGRIGVTFTDECPKAGGIRTSRPVWQVASSVVIEGEPTSGRWTERGRTMIWLYWFGG